MKAKIIYVLVFITILSSVFGKTEQNVYPGIDGDISVLYGHKVGLITNPTGVSSDLKFTGDILFEHPKIKLTAFFAPEHGLRGEKPPGERFETYIDPKTNLPVFSLYSKNQTRAPEPWMLENVTALVFDIQDVGARCYTYISTMALSMESAKKANIPFVVLDRPNPLDGSDNGVSGNILDLKFKSFVGIWSIPMTHGMTIGELALLFNTEMNIGAKLHVIKVRGYEKRLTADQYSNYGWIPPSPNIPNFESALLYPGTVLFEAMRNVSLGRGTTTPFEVIGAPYMDPYVLIDKINELRKLPGYDKYFEGVIIVPAYFQPATSYHSGKLCNGIRIVIINKRKVNAIPLGLTLLKATYDIYKDKTDLSKSWIDSLTGTDVISTMLLNGKHVPDMEMWWQKELNEFKAMRKKYLLY